MTLNNPQLPFPEGDIRAQLARVLKSPLLAKARDLRNLLEYVVEQEISGQGNDLKDGNIAIDVFRRPNDFDPTTDRIVPIRVRDLRARLAKHYDGPGHNDPLEITIPLGGYRPQFRRHICQPVVGREAVLQHFREAFYRASTNRGLLMCVAGEDGIGKTTVIKAFLRTLDHRTLAARSGYQEQDRSAETYTPFLDALRTLLSTTDLVHFLKQAAPSWHTLLKDASTATNLPRDQMKRELLAFLQGVRKLHQIVLVLDDFHSADPLSVELLEFLCKYFEDLRLFIIVAYRDYLMVSRKHEFLSIKPHLKGRGDCEEIILDPLARTDIIKILNELYDPNAFGPDLVDCLYRKTDGNPQLVMLAVKRLHQRALITRLDDRWMLACDTAVVEEELPRSGREMVEDKFRALPKDLDRHLLKAASVQGLYFDSRILADAVTMDPIDVESYLYDLEHLHAFIKVQNITTFPNGTQTLRYRFAHELYWTVLRNIVGPAFVQRLSRLTAESLARHFGDQAHTIAEEMARLFENAGIVPEALKYYELAVQQRLRLFAHSDVIRLANIGLDLLRRYPYVPEKEKYELVLLNYLGLSVLAIEGFAARRLLDIYSRTADLCRALQDPKGMLNALFGLYIYNVDSGCLPTAMELAEQLFAQASALGEGPMVVEALYARGIARLQMGDIAAARQDLEDAISIHKAEFRTTNLFFYNLDPSISACCHLARAQWLLGFPDTALRQSEDALSRATKQEHPETRAYACLFVADIWFHRRDPAMALKYCAKAIKDCEEQGLVQELAWVRTVDAWARAYLSDSRDLPGIIAELRSHLQYYEENILCRVALTKFKAIYAQLCCLLGKTQDALDAINSACALIYGSGEAAGTEEHYYESELLRMKGELLISMGDAAGSRQFFDQAISLSASQGAKMFQLRATASLLRAQRQIGTGTTVVDELKTLYDSFTEGFQTRDLVEAADLIGQPMAVGRSTSVF